jgi:rare lipoprotein A
VLATWPITQRHRSAAFSALLGLALLFGGCARHQPSVDIVAEPPPPPARSTYSAQGKASYYGAWHHGKRTANGEAYDQHALTAAHRSLPFGSRIRVTNLNNGKSVVVRINDRGPYNRRRLIDLSREAAKQLDMLEAGIAPVRLQAIE